MRRSVRNTVFGAGSAIALLALLLYAYYERQGEQREAIALAHSEAAYRSIVAGYREFANVTAAWIIEEADHLALFRRLAAGDDPTARGLLLRRLRPLYESLRRKHVRQLQFIDRSGRSQLRMHAPERSGDSLLGVRPLVGRVLEERSPAAGFENGRVFHGFRFVYPVSAGGELLGALEVSLSFTAIRRLLSHNAEDGTVVRFLLRRSDLLRAMDSGQEPARLHALFDALYQASPVHPGFVTERLDHPLFGEVPEPLPSHSGAVEAALARAAAAEMEANRAFARQVCTAAGECWLATLLPVYDSGGRSVAYIVSYAADHAHVGQLTGAVVAFGGGSLLLAGLAAAALATFRSRAHMRVVSEHVGKGIYVIDRNGRITYANPAACGLLGYGSRELIGQPAHDLLHVESSGVSVGNDACPIRRVTDSGQVYQSSAEVFRHKDGHTIPVEVTASPVREAGEVTGTVTVFGDIRERLATEARLRQSDAAMHHAAEGVLVTDAQQRIVAVNPAFSRLTGYSEADVIGRTPKMLASGRHSRAFYMAMWETIARDGRWQGEIYNRRKDGSVYPERLSIAAIAGSDGALSSYVAVFTDITEVKEKERRLDWLAHHDSLTGLYNRTLLKERLIQAVARAGRRNGRFVLLFIDLDRFKQVNDSLGHEWGDELLRSAAGRIAACLRREDTLVRQGGDEFVILLEDLRHGADAAAVAEKVVDALREAFDVDGHHVFVGASIGLATWPEDGVDGATLMRHADTAMYWAKHAGGNTYRFFNPDYDSDAFARLTLETELRGALERDELVLYYQPKVASEDGRIQAFEALIRWCHPTRGLLAPGEFLPLAQDTGLIVDIGRWTLRRAAAQAAQWQEEGLLPGAVCVNVDGQQLARGDFEHELRRVLEDTGVNPLLLGLELTETAIMMHEDGLAEAARAIRALGVYLSIDDFGTGHSSLARLKQLPFSALKVDASFIRNVAEDAGDQAIVRATVALAHELDLKVVAEGVETEAQLERVRAFGCDAVQGFLYAQPLPAGEATRLQRRARFLAHRAGVYG